MPLLKNANPKYRRHRGTGQAVVTFDGRDIYLGTWGTKVSRAEYDRLLAIWLANGRKMPRDASDMAIVELAEAFVAHARTYYRHADGTPTSEVGCIVIAIRPLLKLYGRETAANFGPVKLEIVRQSMIRAGLARKNINNSINRIKRMFQWATAKELIPPNVYQGLAAVDGLKAGRSKAKETNPVHPVPENRVWAIKPHVARQVWAMILLQWHTGMRPGEVTAMRGCDLDTSGAVWEFRPSQHKTLHHGHARIIQIGPKAQEVLRPFLKLDTAAFIFSPIDAEAERRAALHAARVTPPGVGNTIGTARKGRPRRQPGNRYTTESYCRAVARGCDTAFGMPAEYLDPRTKEAQAQDTPEKKEQRRRQREKWRAENTWHPHQLRHACATQLRKNYGIDAARVVLGHRSVAITETYAQMDAGKAAEIMAQVG